MPTDPEPDDVFGPPAANTAVGCLHCGEVYDSFRIEWRVRADGKGFWSCPVPGCDGIGFGCDIFPTDPDWVDPTGRLTFHSDDEFDENDLDDDTPLEVPPDAARSPDDDIPF